MHTLRRRSLAVRVGTVVTAIGAIAAMALPGASAAIASSPSPDPSSTASASHTKCVTTGVSTTCTGTYSGDNAWNPWTGKQISDPPVVTVSQTKNLTDQVVNVKWQYFTPTLGLASEPNPVSDSQFYEVNVFECKGTNPTPDAQGLDHVCYVYAAGGTQAPDGPPNALMEFPDHTAGKTLAPKASGAPGSYQWGGSPNATGGDPSTWKGSAQFHIEAGAEENSLLGCSVTTPCSLMVVPNFGGNFNISQENTDTSQCENHLYDDPIDAGGTNLANATDSYACQTMDRIIIPLSFAPTASNCPQSNPQFYAEGSPMMSRAMTQWQAGWCTGSSPVTLNFAGIAESEARGAFLQGGQTLAARIDMGLVTLPPDAPAAQASSRKFTYAPLANSGVAMAYYLDDQQTGQQINRVVLDPRLVAKLTTASYSLDYDCTVEPPQINGGQGKQWPVLPNASATCDPAVARNPHTLYDDQEFLSLNKNCQPSNEAANYVCGAADFPSDQSDGGNTSLGVFLPTVLAGDSDMTYQMTDWIAANSDATSFLAGKADPGGTHVNTNYWNTSYPTQDFQVLDPGTKYPQPITCSGNPVSCPLDWDATMNVAWNFVTGLDHISTNLLVYQPNADGPYLTCTLPSGNPCTAAAQIGFAALPPQVPGYRDLFSELDLGDVGAYQLPAASLVNAAGNAVAPTQASVEAAVRDMKTNPDGITQYVNESSTDKAAYPLSMVDYAMVPTCGLPSSEASAIAGFLDKVATTGQTQGNAPGDLAPGYYPLTSAQRAQTLKAARQVKAQTCKSAPKDNTVSGHRSTHNTSNPGNSSHPSGAKTPKRASSPATSPTSSSPGKIQTEAFGEKSPDSGMAGILLLLAIIAGVLLLVGGPTAWVVTTTGKWPVVLRWLRRRG